jgi:Bacterial RNA polymerase, alpha chain C terminal domain
VTDRARVALLPDETPVGALPLLSAVRNALRDGDVRTLGELRTMSDRELMRLRRFGPKSLAAVRAVVPASAGAAPCPTLPDGAVTIAGRVFVLGVVYAPRRGRGRKGGRKPRRLLEYTPAGTFPGGGSVTVEMVPAGVPYVMAGEVWADWAGEPVEDDPGR